eukprot:XP_001709500.1 Hypothetical protein GL50803_38826 [Giardia lamblia ATCC 50803]
MGPDELCNRWVRCPSDSHLTELQCFIRGQKLDHLVIIERSSHDEGTGTLTIGGLCIGSDVGLWFGQQCGNVIVS